MGLGRYSLGVMQGRLLPKYKGRYQAHPKGYWAEEFAQAASFGLELIEFILDFEDAAENPLLALGGAGLISAASQATGIGVKSICADYFMEAPLHSLDPAVATESGRVLGRLLETAIQLGIRDIVIPCVDQSSLRDDAAMDRFVANLSPFAPVAGRMGINLSLETDLAPAPFADLLERFAHPAVTVNYDIGNSASLGFDVREEFAAYGSRISDIHIKDRIRGGGSVELGTGAADMDAAFDLIVRSGYDGPLIMQAFRDDEGLAVFRRQLDWLRTGYAATLS